MDSCVAVLHGVGLRVAGRPGRALLQRRADGDHRADLRKHRGRKKVTGRKIIFRNFWNSFGGSIKLCWRILLLLASAFFNASYFQNCKTVKYSNMPNHLPTVNSSTCHVTYCIFWLTPYFPKILFLEKSHANIGRKHFSNFCMHLTLLHISGKS